MEIKQRWELIHQTVTEALGEPSSLHKTDDGDYYITFNIPHLLRREYDAKETAKTIGKVLARHLPEDIDFVVATVGQAVVIRDEAWAVSYWRRHGEDDDEADRAYQKELEDLETHNTQTCGCHWCRDYRITEDIIPVIRRAIIASLDHRLPGWKRLEEPLEFNIGELLAEMADGAELYWHVTVHEIEPHIVFDVEDQVRRMFPNRGPKEE